MEEPGTSCQVCESLAGSLRCETCLSKSQLLEPWSRLHKAQRKRDELLARLEALLASKNRVQEQHAQKRQLQEERRKALLAKRAAQGKHSKAEREAKSLQLQHSRKAQQLATAKVQLDTWLSGSMGPSGRMHEGLRARTLQLCMLLDKQSQVTRTKVRALLEVFPISIPALRAPGQEPRPGAAGPLSQRQQVLGTGSPRTQQAPYVTVRGLRLPDTLNPVVENEAEAQKLGSALGYVVLLTRLLAHYLHAPLLHCLVYRGSTCHLAPLSTLHRPLKGGGRLFAEPWHASGLEAVLFVPANMPAPPPAPTPPGPAGVASTLQALGGHALARFSSLTRGGSVAVGSAVAAAVQQASLPSRPSQSLPTGLHSLARSLAALLAHAQGVVSGRLPSEWNPFACLAAICAQLVVDPRAERARAASSGHSMLLKSSILAGNPMQESLARAFMLDREDEDDMVDGWDLVQRPFGWGEAGDSTFSARTSPTASVLGTFQSLQSLHPSYAGLQDGERPPLLPPTPSQNDDIAHWERAMFTDATSRAAVAHAAAAAGSGMGGIVGGVGGIVGGLNERTWLAATNMLSSPLAPFRRSSSQH
ncbi:hypothetical protein WJX73_000119 [Symbiochloris irregularis]|uniref:Uncharacterized protein n=1 Tax=Symbiochloris irregularis TaxID=706552 RepID=A0AAW1PVK5_9CHLO